MTMPVTDRAEKKGKPNLLLVFTVVMLVCVLAKDEAAAQAITVTPADPRISVGQTQQFTATGIDAAAAVEAGVFHQCALPLDATLRCWGLSDYGQLGNGTVSSAQVPNSTPVEVIGITTATAVTAGGYHACALLHDGTVRCWGQNDYGQLGDGAVITPQTRPPTPRPSPNPVEVRGITTAVAIKAGIFHTCALLRDGTMQCWGWNDYFQLGEPAAVNASSTPVTVSGITPSVLAPGAEHTCVLLRVATVDCWGDNNYSQNANGSARGIFAPPTAAVTGI